MATFEEISGKITIAGFLSGVQAQIFSAFADAYVRSSRFRAAVDLWLSVNPDKNINIKY